MMPDLGRYAVEVISAYLASLSLIGALGAWYWLRGRAVRRALEDVEARKAKNG